MSADKFLQANQEVNQGNLTAQRGENTSYGGSSSDDSINQILTDSPESDESENDKQIRNLISELRLRTSRQKEERCRKGKTEKHRGKELSTETIHHCMDEQFERARRDELDELIKAAEKGKAEVFRPPGKDNFNHQMTTAEIYDTLFHTTSHVDKALREKIEKGQFIDLAKLLPKEKGLHEDGHLTMIQWDGFSNLQPVTHKEAPGITNIKRWEQAFEVYASIFTEKNPSRAGEIFRYIFNIKTAAATYVWDNVYMYDVKFRELIELYPWRNWGVIYQQGWSMEKHGEKSGSSSSGALGHFKKKYRGKTICWHFNKGKCSYVTNCKFEHRCYFCQKADHAAAACQTRKNHEKG